jgi:hypothetical protein
MMGDNTRAGPAQQPVVKLDAPDGKLTSWQAHMHAPPRKD